MPQALVEAFSSRSRDINTETDRLIEEYVANHGRRPRAATIMKLRQRANLAHRPEKQVLSLADLTSMWRGRAAHNVGVCRSLDTMVVSRHSCTIYVTQGDSAWPA